MKLIETSNRLINEKSPYLLQHAHNPVDWYPWCDEAFKKAKEEDKPVFLSIGYSTCHWCHVMERESFEDNEVAEILNGQYVPIKVDREERPDIDTIYMAVCQAITGHGGWPLTIIMTPDKKPFYAGTYFPKSDARGIPGLMTLLSRIAELWRDERNTLVNSSEKVTQALNDQMFTQEAGEIGEDTLDRAFRHYEDAFDPHYGGFGRAPKFPSPHNLSFLLRQWKMTGDGAALEIVEKTLESMYRGGIYDHIGFGFARYSTDHKWLVPHFEKMLYDNALLAIAYLETYQATKKYFYARAAREIFTYVLRDMTSPEGAFYSAEDADSEGEEGKFYVWTPEEVKEVLGDNLGRHYCQDFDITEKGNFEGKSIPNLIETGLVEGYDDARGKLFQARDKRVHPFKDDKVLTAWNGLMIAAMALGARVLHEPRYLSAAKKATQFILNKLRREDGRLLARYRNGEAAFLAYVDDYAFFIWGLIELYQASFKNKYLDLALELNKNMLQYFWDSETGGLYQYGSDAEVLITRPKEIYDGAMPSGNSVAALNLQKLARLTEDESLSKTAERQIKAFGHSISEHPIGHSFFLIAVWFSLTPPLDVAVVGEWPSEEAETLLKQINSNFLPEALVKLNPEGKQPLGDKPAAFVCKDFTCHPPIADTKKLEQLLLT